MAANTLSILRPSVNNLTARIFVRAAGLDFDELDVWGKKDAPEFVSKDPAQLTPMLEEEGLEVVGPGVRGRMATARRLPFADIDKARVQVEFNRKDSDVDSDVAKDMKEEEEA